MKKTTVAELEIAGGVMDTEAVNKPRTEPPAKLTTTNNGDTKAKVEHWPPSKLKPYERNPTLHPPDHVTQIAKSITEFGFTVPVLCDEDFMILAGHGRHLAAMELKLDTVPVIRRYGLTPEQKRAYVLADNKIARNAEFDWTLIAGELRDLNEAGFNLDLTGFESYEIEPLLQAQWGQRDVEDIDGLEFAPTHMVVFTGVQWDFSKASRGEGQR